MKKFISTLIIIAIALSFAPTAFAKGGSVGGRSGGFRSAPRPSAPRITPPAVRPAPVTPTRVTPVVAPKPVIKDTPKPRITAKPSATTKTVTNNNVGTTKSGKKLNSKGSVIDDNYKPRFRNGSTYPSGSTVYYPQRDFLDYLPWIFLFTMDSHRPVVVYPPANASSTTPVAPIEEQEEGVDTMYIINWIMTILLTGGVIGGIVWYINRRTN